MTTHYKAKEAEELAGGVNCQWLAVFGADNRLATLLSFTTLTVAS